MNSITSPAKINLFLRVLSRREDGYHEIASLFQAISLYDKLYYTLADKDQLTCSDPSLLCDESNLIIRALKTFKRKTGLHFSLNLHLEKNIPIEAGLGGGSANAATTLFLCNSLHNFPLSEQELGNLGFEVGSDVPFFFSNGTAFCTGRGEKVEPLSSLTWEKKMWLVKPHLGLSTKLIFTNLIPEQCATIDARLLLNNWMSGFFTPVNDLEKPAFRLLPELEELKRNLMQQGFDAVFMTGSGTALVCIGNEMPIVDSNVTCYPLSFVNRNDGEWYK